jgi:hypothetical protein
MLILQSQNHAIELFRDQAETSKPRQSMQVDKFCMSVDYGVSLNVTTEREAVRLTYTNFKLMLNFAVFSAINL